MGHDNAADIETYVLELSAKAQNVLVICDSEVSTDLILFNVLRTDHYDDFCLILKLLEHVKLAVRLEAWQYTAGMIVVE